MEKRNIYKLSPGSTSQSSRDLTVPHNSLANFKEQSSNVLELENRNLAEEVVKSLYHKGLCYDFEEKYGNSDRVIDLAENDSKTNSTSTKNSLSSPRIDSKKNERKIKNSLESSKNMISYIEDVQKSDGTETDRSRKWVHSVESDMQSILERNNRSESNNRVANKSLEENVSSASSCDVFYSAENMLQSCWSNASYYTACASSRFFQPTADNNDSKATKKKVSFNTFVEAQESIAQSIINGSLESRDIEAKNNQFLEENWIVDHRNTTNTADSESLSLYEKIYKKKNVIENNQRALNNQTKSKSSEVNNNDNVAHPSTKFCKVDSLYSTFSQHRDKNRLEKIDDLKTNTENFDTTSPIPTNNGKQSNSNKIKTIMNSSNTFKVDSFYSAHSNTADDVKSPDKDTNHNTVASTNSLKPVDSFHIYSSKKNLCKETKTKLSGSAENFIAVDSNFSNNPKKIDNQVVYTNSSECNIANGSSTSSTQLDNLHSEFSNKNTNEQVQTKTSVDNIKKTFTNRYYPVDFHSAISNKSAFEKNTPTNASAIGKCSKADGSEVSFKHNTKPLSFASDENKKNDFSNATPEDLGSFVKCKNNSQETDNVGSPSLSKNVISFKGYFSIESDKNTSTDDKTGESLITKSNGSKVIAKMKLIASEGSEALSNFEKNSASCGQHQTAPDRQRTFNLDCISEISNSSKEGENFKNIYGGKIQGVTSWGENTSHLENSDERIQDKELFSKSSYSVNTEELMNEPAQPSQLLRSNKLSKQKLELIPSKVKSSSISNLSSQITAYKHKESVLQLECKEPSPLRSLVPNKWQNIKDRADETDEKKSSFSSNSSAKNTDLQDNTKIASAGSFFSQDTQKLRGSVHENASEDFCSNAATNSKNNPVEKKETFSSDFDPIREVKNRDIVFSQKNWKHLANDSSKLLKSEQQRKTNKSSTSINSRNSSNTSSRVLTDSNESSYALGNRVLSMLRSTVKITATDSFIEPPQKIRKL